MRASIVRLALGALLVALSVPAAAQQSEKVYRIGILAGSAQAFGWQPRNEWESPQILARSGVPIDGVSVTSGDLSGPDAIPDAGLIGGGSIPRSGR